VSRVRAIVFDVGETLIDESTFDIARAEKLLDELEFPSDWIRTSAGWAPRSPLEELDVFTAGRFCLYPVKTSVLLVSWIAEPGWFLVGADATIRP
jgi:hypothetical protein